MSVELPVDDRGIGALRAHGLRYRRALRALKGLVGEGEAVFALAEADLDGTRGLLLATAERLLFSPRRLFRRSVVEFRLDEIRLVHSEAGILAIWDYEDRTAYFALEPAPTARAISRFVRTRVAASRPRPSKTSERVWVPVEVEQSVESRSKPVAGGDEDDVIEPAAEALAVLSWRRESLRAMGFSDADAETLSATTVDLGDVRRLVESGCTPELAKKILL